MKVRPLSGRLLGRGRRKGGKGPTGREMDKGKSKDATGVAKAKEEEEDDKSLCESEGQSDNGSVEEKEDITTNGSVSIGGKPGL